ncbi:hypothetical protein ACP275_10G017100 [Erythranthe tilingii]
MGGKRVRIHTDFQLKKCAKISFVGHVDDRVSQLPDDVLADILSRLSLKEAGRTSVLSSRWMNLWKHTNSLNFDTERVSHKHFAQRKSLKRDRRMYVEWVNSVLRSHKSTVLKEFRIRFPLNASDRNTITQWLKFAFSRQVQKLELDIKNNYDPTEEYCFPNGLLIPSSCRASKLQPPSDNICIDHHPCMLFDFKSLKAVSFKSVGVSDGDINFFLDNCPQLEQLIVIQSKKLSKPEICGSSLKLKHLELVDCCGLESLKVSAPSLTSLRVTSLDGLLLENVPMLVDISISCEDGNLSIQHLFCLLSCCISQLQTLCLTLKRREGRGEIDELPKMPKLKKLVVVYRASGHENLNRLAAFIRASPNLVEFELQFKWFDALSRRDREVKDAIKILHHHLKVFKFCGYYGATNDVELLSYILGNCVVLEKIIIDPYFIWSCDKLQVEETARNNAKQKLAPQVPQHIELVIL